MTTQIINDEFCPWPFFKPYGMVEVKVKKPRKKRAITPSRRDWLAVDLAKPKYHQRIVPSKKRKNDRSKIVEIPND